MYDCKSGIFYTDIVMISSSSGEDDDCIVISEDDEESEPEEDTSNSGMHTNDLYNVPDDQGRVLINVGHPDNEKDVFLAPQIARIIKPHQVSINDLGIFNFHMNDIVYLFLIKYEVMLSCKIYSRKLMQIRRKY